MQDAIEQVDIIDVQPHPAPLQQVEQVGFGVFGDVPDRSRPDGDILGLFHVLQHGDGVARKLQYAG
ncbi:hypothetical protein ES708_31407 [subsurface metagenome]